MTTACRLIYAAAGSPERDDFEPITGPCWWCGHDSPTGRGWPLSRLSSSFQGSEIARAPLSEVVCAPCAWTMGVGVHLPPAYARERLASKAEQGRRVDLDRDGERIKRLALVLDDGRIGLWTTAIGGKEAAWQAATAELRAAPRTVGKCEYEGAFELDTLTPGADRFMQAFHHFLVGGVWEVRTDADKPWIRAHLLRDDITGPAVTSLVTTQGKHTIIHTPVEWPATGTRCVYFGGPVYYRPAELAHLLYAVESLRLAGAAREEMSSGDYAGRATLEWLRARRLDDVLQPHRGSQFLDLAIYLCRPFPQLQEAPPVPPGPPTHPEPSRGPVDAIPGPDPRRLEQDQAAAPTPPSRPPADRPRGPAQLRLF